MIMKKIPAIVVRQWLKPEWDQAKFEPVPPRDKPEPHFYLFSISAYDLKRLSGIYRRDPSKHPAEDMSIQRQHLPERSREILRYLQDGFPLSRIDRKKLVDPSEADTLRMPGWLSTAIVVNILEKSDRRGPKNSAVAEQDLLKIHHFTGQSIAEIELPKNLNSSDWQPVIHPVEIIDGQHRLWALEEPEQEEERWTDDFKKKIAELEIPVVAFHGLDRTWQAYLFYTINQLPKKIDQSLVFDLYPLLRNEDWLLRFEGPNIYRENRAQDLTILLWSHPESSWKERIIRLGGRDKGKVTQASFIRSLKASFIKRWQEGEGRIGGFFGAPAHSHHLAFNWSREQQAALLILAWQELEKAVKSSEADWATVLVKMNMKSSTLTSTEAQKKKEKEYRQLLFSGPDSLIATDQGVRGYLSVLNDLLGMAQRKGNLDASSWNWTRLAKHKNDDDAVSDALITLRKQMPELVNLVRSVAISLADFDWRLASAIPKREEENYNRQAAYRGSGGYSLLRRNLLTHLKDKAHKPVSEFASDVIDVLGYETEEDF